MSVAARSRAVASREALLVGLGRRPHLVGALVTLVLSAVMVGPGLVPGRVLSSADVWWGSAPWTAEWPPGFNRPGNTDLEDAAQQFQPLREEVKRQLPDVPLWDPWIASGRPLLADAQSAVFSPFTLPGYVMPLQKSLVWTALLTLWAAAFGMFGLARALGMRLPGALMAGIVYGLNLWLVSWVSYPHSAVWALLPWLLWGTERLVRRPDAVSVALLAGVVGVQFLAGHPESSFHVLLATVAFFALRLGLAWRAKLVGGLQQPLVAMAAALVAGVGLAAVLLVPFLELLFTGSDLEARSGTGVDAHLDAEFLLAFFLPDYWGRATDSALIAFLFSRAWYVGALPLMLAAAALIVRPRAERLWIAGAAALLLAVIFGLPPFVQIATRVPLLSLGHNGRLIVVVLACVALLAGWGIDELSARGGARRRPRMVLVAAVAVLVLPLVMVAGRGEIDSLAPRAAVEVAFGLTDAPPAGRPGAGDVIRLAAVVAWLCLAVAALVLLVARVRGLPGRVFAGLALGLVVVDLLWAGMGYNPSIPEAHARQPVTGALRFLLKQRPARFAGLGDVPQNVPALRHRLPDARGNDPPILERYNRLWRQEVSPEVPEQASELDFTSPFLQVPRVDERRLRTLRLLGVGYLLVPPRAHDAELGIGGMRVVYRGPDARVLRVEGALPRAFVVGAQQPVTGERAALEALTRPGLDHRRVVVTERRLAGIPQTAAGGSAGSARIAVYEPDRVVIDARLSRRGVVVLSDNWYPGWKARVDGRPADLHRVDYVLRGTVVDRGRHRVELVYEPASWRIGWITSLLTLAALTAAVLIGRRRATAPLVSPTRWRTGPTNSTSTSRTATGGSGPAGTSSGR